MDELDAATRSSLSLSLEREFGVSLEDIESFTRWYLAAYADYPPGNRYVDPDGFAIHPQTKQRWSR